jgi:hypothetical protein
VSEKEDAMSIRMLVLGAVVLGAAGQLACSTEADASEVLSTGTASDPSSTPPGQGEGQFCGGFGNIQCPSGLQCVDDPNDTCEPAEGGADCGGICVSSGDDGDDKKPKCDKKEPLLSYVSRDPAECAAIFFVCPDGAVPFFNECGCGCQTTEKACNYEDPSRRYVSMDPAQCASLRFICDIGEGAFFDSCGCGCEKTLP